MLVLGVAACFTIASTIAAKKERTSQKIDQTGEDNTTQVQKPTTRTCLSHFGNEKLQDMSDVQDYQFCWEH